MLLLGLIEILLLLRVALWSCALVAGAASIIPNLLLFWYSYANPVRK